MADENSQNQNKKGIVANIKQFAEELWTVPSASEKAFRRWLIIATRIIYTVVIGISKKRILVQASSLSYATLLAIGPILAITIMFSSIFFKGREDDKFVYNQIMAAATFVMPAFNEMIADDVSLANESASKTTSTTQVQTTASATTEVKRVEINKEIINFINNISKSSAKAGVVGMIAMLLTCLLLLVNMETAFNYIWGVEDGRNWTNRVVFYFVMIFFGSVGRIFAAALFATPTIAKFFSDVEFIRDYVHWISYCFGVIVMIIVLSCFYKFIPFTKVTWRSAIIGGIVITFLLLLNNKASFLYISYIGKQKDLYGYLAIVVIAMFSLYVFWTFLLSGGLVSYAVQFVGFFDDDQVWNKIGDRAKRMCALAVFSEISKDFYKRGAGCRNLDQLSQKLKLPKVLLSMCVRWLVRKDLLCLVDEPNSDSISIKPSVSPDSITVADFLSILTECPDDKSINERLGGYENSVKLVLSAIYDLSKHEIFSKKIKDII